VSTFITPPALPPADASALAPRETSTIDAEPAFRDGAAARVFALGRAASTVARTGAFFLRFLVTDAGAGLGRALPAVRAFAARLRVQWTRAAERARSRE
jgi:hypothetical protein